MHKFWFSKIARTLDLPTCSKLNFLSIIYRPALLFCINKIIKINIVKTRKFRILNTFKMFRKKFCKIISNTYILDVVDIPRIDWCSSVLCKNSTSCHRITFDKICLYEDGDKNDKMCFYRVYIWYTRWEWVNLISSCKVMNFYSSAISPWPSDCGLPPVRRGKNFGMKIIQNRMVSLTQPKWMPK